MTSWFRPLAGFLWLTLAHTAIAETPAAPSAGSLQIKKAWVRAVPPVSDDSAAYLTIENTGSSADTLESVSTPAAGVAALHRMTMHHEIMKMQALKSLALPAGKTVTMDPSGLHIMLEHLKSPLKAGDTIPLTLHFHQAGTLTVQASVIRDE